MPDVTINGITVTFPFEPYTVQEAYMSKVIECLQNKKHGVLESPTGTGKTLCLLCSSLSWLLVKKAQLQIQAVAGVLEQPDFGGQFFSKLRDGLENEAGSSDSQQNTNFGWVMPKIVYASRTHSQLSQAMQELKRTSYKHVKVAVLGSRDQLCIHPEVSREQNSSNKIHMCQAKVRARTCHYYNNVELRIQRKDEPVFKQEICDIEDLVKAGQKLKCCPYFLSKELKQSADITFMPYNYLLDPKTRKSQGIDLQGNIVLLDEAHNVEKTCEEAASLQISSTDVALCIAEITHVMEDVAKDMNDQVEFAFEGTGNVQKDFTPEDLCILKAMFLELEKAIDEIKLKNTEGGETLPGGFIFELLEKASLIHGKEQLVIDKLEKIIMYLSTTSTSPFTRKGNALQKFSDLLRTVFSSGGNNLRHRERVKQCYKVYVQREEPKKTGRSDAWESKKMPSKTDGKIISYWCFSPGFGMQQLVEQGIHSVILTSGTLSPLKPFISELGIPIDVQLENPHIVGGKQVIAGVLSEGPDGFQLNSSFNTRNDPKYISSLGRTIYNFSCLVPHGLLVFFPSYPVMKKCRDDWQSIGLWSKIADRKPIYVEPQSKDGFTNIMNEFYEKIRDPSCKGAIFLAVCRGKVSEGLDFANANGRAVIITGLPYPPLKDPRVMLKQRYLDENRVKQKEGLSGQQWYQLEASRAVNQAIGRIIRHRNDYGAILLCDCRFGSTQFKSQLSAWLRPHIKHFNNFGVITKDLRMFFRYAEQTLPKSEMRPLREISEFSLPAVPAKFDTVPTKILQTSSLNVSTTLRENNDSFNVNMYKETQMETSRDNDTSTKIEFSNGLGSKPMKSPINFANCKLKDDWDRCELTKDTNEPNPKRRKRIIMPTELYSNTSGPSTSNHSTEKSNPVEKKPEIGDKKELGKTYLRKVKRTLSQEKYKEFAAMIQNYTKNGDVDELLRCLEVLFPPSGKLQHLFVGFRSFLKKDHLSSFDIHVSLFPDVDSNV
ncbi:regulator of telomere elongation helicase 1 homolog isoform X2 [Venturia canescens]|uniref:regulator of telomere elongation helicase 1 homolog isoform X2 n=1 Tax=Venturia canescens TaxID=32260 RepID=UPI001C9C7DE1|nr:regulator of telomere elongation helicase 1 homolog isoform X2 [Venturia canescens]